jgi:ribonuclease HII
MTMPSPTQGPVPAVNVPSRTFTLAYHSRRSMRSHITPSLDAERAFWQAGVRLVAGVDEAGRGAWAGPVVAAAVILPRDERVVADLDGVTDSKQLTPAKREALRARIQQVALAWSVGSASSAEIDALGILAATRLAMLRAVSGLSPAPEALLIDALSLPALALPQRAFARADALSLSVAAASILAKTTRDALMCALDAELAGYGFARHKGYGTRAHLQAIRRLGACPIHRRTFKPLAQLALDLPGPC